MRRNRAVPIYRFRHLIRAALVVFWIALFASTHTPPEKLIAVGALDKSLHLASYLILAFLSAFATSTRHSLRLRSYLVLFLLIAAYGVIDELLQIPINRTADVVDWAADVTGGMIGLALFAATQWAIPALWQTRAN